MKFVVCSIKDRLNGFMNVFLEQNLDMAKRGFLHGIQSAGSESLYFSHPDDYSLYCLGTFDTDSGLLELSPTPEFLIEGPVKKGTKKGAK